MGSAWAVVAAITSTIVATRKDYLSFMLEAITIANHLLDLKDPIGSCCFECCSMTKDQTDC